MSISPQVARGRGWGCAWEPLRSSGAFSSCITSWQSRLCTFCQPLPLLGEPQRGRSHLRPQVPPCPFLSGSPGAKGPERRLGALRRKAAQPWPSGSSASDKRKADGSQGEKKSLFVPHPGSGREHLVILPPVCSECPAPGNSCMLF
ncbi:hypothetical protein HJG60_010370 [Phyllostomus discolor]|uniref:Uncharacterized protein n=1 Tax=Phyllostomus discolor TaxID=89673 RepID=A0A834AZZ6_9CHIR|nr:hypothetical protein HJG60_010370 [Phyllostomus discolor]